MYSDLTFNCWHVPPWPKKSITKIQYKKKTLTTLDLNTFKQTLKWIYDSLVNMFLELMVLLLIEGNTENLEEFRGMRSQPLSAFLNRLGVWLLAHANHSWQSTVLVDVVKVPLTLKVTWEILSGFWNKIFKSLKTTNIFFFTLLPYTEFISWTYRLRNVHRIPNNTSPVPFTMAFVLLLGKKLASHLLLSSLYHTSDLHFSWDKPTHPSQFVLLSYLQFINL